jgi:hypothetical protein
VTVTCLISIERIHEVQETINGGESHLQIQWSINKLVIRGEAEAIAVFDDVWLSTA